MAEGVVYEAFEGEENDLQLESVVIQSPDLVVTVLWLLSRTGVELEEWCTFLVWSMILLEEAFERAEWTEEVVEELSISFWYDLWRVITSFAIV